MNIQELKWVFALRACRHLTICCPSKDTGNTIRTKIETLIRSFELKLHVKCETHCSIEIQEKRYCQRDPALTVNKDDFTKT